jgi:hypothetical protein
MSVSVSELSTQDLFIFSIALNLLQDNVILKADTRGALLCDNSQTHVIESDVV